MSIYERFGVKPLINGAGTKTRLGGIRMTPEVLQAMADATRDAVDMAYLQAAASRAIADITGAEAGYVTSGAAAGLTLSAAACIAGIDPAKIDKLPCTEGLPNKIIIFRSHRNSYDHAWRAAGARLVEVGLDDRIAGSGVRSLDPWEIEAAIDEDSVAVAYVANRANHPPLRRVVDVAHQHELPVLVDAAAQLPPEDNLKRFISEGADLVAFSGGKAIGGPQGTGILCGRRQLIQAVMLNQLDMDVDLEHWDPPAELLSKEEIKGLPRHGIGRGFKISKENIVGLLTALRKFSCGAWRGEVDSKQHIANRLVAGLGGVEGLKAQMLNSWGYPCVELTFASKSHAGRVYKDLLRGEPGIALDPAKISEGILLVNTIDLQLHEGQQIETRLKGATTSESGAV